MGVAHLVRAGWFTVAVALALGACSDAGTGGVGAPIDGGTGTAGDGFVFPDTGAGPQDGAATPDGASTPDAAGDDGAATPDAAATPDTAGPQDAATAPDTGGGQDTGAGQDTAQTNPTGEPQIAVQPTNYTFSYVAPITTILSKQITVMNVGTGPLTITKIQFAPGSSQDFTFLWQPPAVPKVIQPSKSIILNIRFQDVEGGTATLQIESDDPTTPLVEVTLASYLKATVDTPDPCGGLQPSKLNFGQVQRGDTKVLQATLKNCSETMPLKLNSITRSTFFFVELTQEFQIDNQPQLPYTIPPGGQLQLAVSYQPKLAGPDSGYFAFHTDDPNEPELQLDVVGVGTSPPPEEIGLMIKLSWDSDGCDVDSHLIAPGGTFFDCTTDCHFGNPSPDWGTQGDWVDDPFLDVDDVDGYGPEHINISEPQPGTYKFVVHYYSDSYEDGMSTETNATVEVYSYDQLIGTYGPVHLSSTNDTWDVFTLGWPGASLTPLGTSVYQISSSQMNTCFNFP